MKTVKLLLSQGGCALLRSIASFSVPFYFVIPPLFAQTVYWDFSGSSLAGQSSHSYVRPGEAYTGPGVSTSGFPDDACSGSEPWSVRGWYNTSSIYEAINNGDYVAFPVSVDPGESFHITGISFSSNRSINAAGDERGPRIWAVYAHYGSSSSFLFSGRNPTGETGASAPCAFHSDAVDIRLRGGESVTFRIYAYSDVANEITTMRIDDFTLDGTRLPVRLSNFSAREEDGKVMLSWQTHVEQDNAYMAVERGADGQYFYEIGRVAGAGTSNRRREYFLTDPAPLPGINYYRLRQVDFDGREEIHPVVSVQIRSTGIDSRIFPTLAGDHLSVRFPRAPERGGELYIYNTLGRVVHRLEAPAGALQQQFEISSLLEGTYVVQYRAGREQWVLGRFVKR